MKYHYSNRCFTNRMMGERRPLVLPVQRPSGLVAYPFRAINAASVA